MYIDGLTRNRAQISLNLTSKAPIQMGKTVAVGPIQSRPRGFRNHAKWASVMWQGVVRTLLNASTKAVRPVLTGVLRFGNGLLASHHRWMTSNIDGVAHRVCRGVYNKCHDRWVFVRG